MKSQNETFCLPVPIHMCVWGGVNALLIKEILKFSNKLWLVICSIMTIGGTIMMPVQAEATEESKDVSTVLQCGFIENLGQWPDEVLFMANTKSLRAWITTKGMVFEQFENTKSENK